MKKGNILRYFLSLLTIISTLDVLGQGLQGDWTGKLEIGGGRAIKLVLHIDVKAPSVTLDSPDQAAYGLECETVHLKDDSLNIQIPSLFMSYAGHIKDGALSGTFKQGGVALPLSFKPGLEKANRPQTPQPPFPYAEEAVSIPNPAANAILSGTLTIPQNANANTPVVVFVSGSGAQNRDEELFEHKPFAVIADYLARKGIASLRYDDRGFGESTGDRSAATTADYAQDAQSAIDWVRKQERFGKAGIIGHSEGGIIAYMLGAASNGTDFIVSIAGPSVDGATILDYQNKYALMKNGLPEKDAERHAIEARRKIQADSTMIWMNYFLKTDPAPFIQNLKIPAMIVYGEMDQQVPASLNYEPAKRYAPKAIVKKYRDLNHLMQHAKTGGIEEYSSIEETISPEVLSDIATFILYGISILH